MARRITRTRRAVAPCVSNNAAALLARGMPQLHAEECERLAYMAGLPTDLYEAHTKLEGFNGSEAYLTEAKGSTIEEDWLSDELALLQSIAKRMRPIKANPLRDGLLTAIRAIETRREEAVKAEEYRMEQLNLLEKAIDSLIY